MCIWEFCIFGLLEFWNLGSFDFATSRLLDFFIFDLAVLGGLLDFLIFECCDVMISRLLDFYIVRFVEFGTSALFQFWDFGTTTMRRSSCDVHFKTLKVESSACYVQLPSYDIRTLGLWNCVTFCRKKKICPDLNSLFFARSWVTSEVVKTFLK